MSSFTINNQNATPLQNLTTTFKTILGITALTGATTLRRVWITEVAWGAFNVPNATDCMITFDISKQTTTGTSVVLTPQPTDVGGGDAAALAVYGANHTAEPTITANTSIFNKSINQRASDKQWWRDKATCPITNAVTVNGLAMRALSTNYASTFGLQASVEE
jgi:hypothetical protein